tara:strand:+ start:50 stop:391 length:342 start_codon:yes stop_codon:yes gene_type:complete
MTERPVPSSLPQIHLQKQILDLPEAKADSASSASSASVVHAHEAHVESARGNLDGQMSGVSMTPAGPHAAADAAETEEEAVVVEEVDEPEVLPEAEADAGATETGDDGGGSSS